MPESFDPRDIENLMPMPISSVRLAEMVSDPASTIREFTRVIELDQALTVDVLHWANYSFSAPDKEIATVRDAVVRLGTANILKLAVGQHLLAAFSPSLSKTDYGENELWRHSVAAALAAENLAVVSEVPIPGMAFTAALIHDVGKLILCRRLGYDTIHEVIQSIIEEKQVTYIEAEQTFLGTDHAQIGGAMARHWHFSDDLIAAIENHHRLDIEHGILLDAIIVSDSLAHCVDRELPHEYKRILAHLSRLKVSDHTLVHLSEKIRQEMNNAESLWNTSVR
jgi:putative nucleotidyltransferase with HDIG domain